MTRNHLEERNKKMRIRRQAGASLHEIAIEFGISKERVRQVLNGLYGGTYLEDFVTSRQAGRMLGFRGESLRKLAVSGVVKFVRSGRRYMLYRKDLPHLKTILKERVARSTICEICGKVLPPLRKKYCSARCMWRARRRRYRSDPERARRQDQIVRKWQKEHIERFREICRRAAARYRQRRKNITS